MTKSRRSPADVVFVHGFGADRLSWLATTAAVDAGRSLLLDLPGHGRSRHPARTSGALVDWLVDVLEQRVTAPVHVVGHSLGGGLALRAAARAPALFRSLFLLSPVGLGREVDDAFLTRYPAVRDAAEMRALLLTLVERPSLISQQMVAYAVGQLDVGGRRDALARIAAAVVEDEAEVRRAATEVARAGLTRQVLWGAADRINPLDQAALDAFGPNKVFEATGTLATRRARERGQSPAFGLRGSGRGGVGSMKGSGAVGDEASLRRRAAWLYYGHGCTQAEIARQLSLSRSTVVRLLERARQAGDVTISIAGGDDSCLALGVALERAHGIERAIVVPSVPGGEASRPVGLALGTFLTELIGDDLTVGVGWGRTLDASLASFSPPRRDGVRVLSMLGSTFESAAANPAEYSWRMANALGAECTLFPSPLVVDSAETAQRLFERCGLDRLRTLAQGLDVAVIGVGDMRAEGDALCRSMLGAQELASLAASGCIAEVLGDFVDASGTRLDHPVHERVMSLGCAATANARHRVIAAGGRHKATALRAAIRRAEATVVVTDEAAARELL